MPKIEDSNPWGMIDLGRLAVVKQIVLSNSHDDGHTTNGVFVEVGANTDDMELLDPWLTPIGSTTPATIAVTRTAPIRYVRFTITKWDLQGKSAPRIDEVEIYGLSRF